VSAVASFNRTLDQELAALERGASLECLVCGEFVLHLPHSGLVCPECGSGLVAGGEAQGGLQLSMQAG
jgi:Zn finger protein HypA/HybF involved in hydrogenase expression